MRDTVDLTEERSVEATLAEWREVERELADATPGSILAEALEAEAERLHAEYVRLFDEAREHYQPQSLPHGPATSN